MTEVPVKKGEEAEKTPAARAEGGWHPLVTLRDEIDRLFDDFFSSGRRVPFGRRGFDLDPWRRVQTTLGMTFPTVDIAEDDKAYKITAELPGMTEKDIEVTLAGGALMLKGEKKEEREEKEKDYYLSERRYGSFQRSFRLPEDADAEKIEASCKNGVL